MPKASIISQYRVESTPLDKVAGSDEQHEIWRVLMEEKVNLMVKAGPGTGKSYTSFWGAKKVQARDKGLKIAMLAFNKSIADEMEGKLGVGSTIRACTYHSFGMDCVRKMVGRLEVNKWKSSMLADKWFKQPSGIGDGLWVKCVMAAKEWAGLAKQYVVDYEDFEKMVAVVDHHSVEVPVGRDEMVWEMARELMKRSREMMRVVDYDDMIWLPAIERWPVPEYDLVFVDEAQDTNLAQQWLVMQAAKRMVVVGDENQAIYGFRGSDSQSMERMKRELKGRKEGVKVLPLTISQRCPEVNVEVCRFLMPGFKAKEGAGRGLMLGGAVLEGGGVKVSDGVGEEHGLYGKDLWIEPGDMVVCRVNADLISLAYQLIAKKVRCYIKGREVGEGLLKLLDRGYKARAHGYTGNGRKAPKVDEIMFADVLVVIEAIVEEEIEQLMAMPNKRGVKRAEKKAEQLECLKMVAAGEGRGAKLGDVRRRLEDLFGEPGDGVEKGMDRVTLGTVHRLKGLESHRVWLLRPDLMPHPKAGAGWELDQEICAVFIALSRTKGGVEVEGVKGVLEKDGVTVLMGALPGVPAAFEALVGVMKSQEEWLRELGEKARSKGQVIGFDGKRRLVKK